MVVLGGGAVYYERVTPVPPHSPRSNSRCRANSAHVRQSRPDYGLRVQGNVLEPFSIVPSSRGSGNVNVLPLPLLERVAGYEPLERQVTSL